MRLLSLTAAACLGLFAACDVSHPVAVVGLGNIVYKGSATATFLEGGCFQVSNGRTNCQGGFRPASQTATVTSPVSCSNGLSGVGMVTSETPRAGGGEIVMQDGTRWRFIFGREALVV